MGKYVDKEGKKSKGKEIEKFAGMTAAAAIALSIAYKKGLNDALSTGYKSVKRGMKGFRKEFSGSSLLNANYDKFADSGDAFMRGIKNEANNSLSIDFSNNKGLGNIISTGKKILNDDSYNYRISSSDSVVALKQHIQKSYDFTYDQLNIAFDFVDKTMSNPSKLISATDGNKRIFNKSYVNEHLSKNVFKDQDIVDSLIKDIDKQITSKTNPSKSDSIILNNNIVGKLFDTKDLQKKLGYIDDDGNIVLASIKQKNKNFLLGDRPATVDEILENKRKFKKERIFYSNNNNAGSSDFFDELEKFRDIDKENGKLFFDENLRTGKDGKIRDFNEFNKDVKKKGNEFDKSIIGRIFKTGDVKSAGNAPNVFMTKKGTFSPILSRTMDKNGSLITDKDIIKIHDKSYIINSERELEHVKELDNLHMISGNKTMMSKMINNMSGNVERSYHENKKNKLLDFLDLNDSKDPSIFNRATSFFKKFGDDKYGRNIIKNYSENAKKNNDILENYDSNSKEFIDALNESRESAFSFNNLMEDTTIELNDDALKRLKNDSRINHKKILEALYNSSDEELAEWAISTSEKSIKNDKLSGLIKRALRSVESVTDFGYTASNHKGILGRTETIDYNKRLRKELGKEFLLQESSEKGYKNLVDIIGSSGMDLSTVKETTHLLDYSVIEEFSKNATSRKPKDVVHVKDSLIKINNMFYGESDNSKEFKEHIEQTMKEKVSVLQRGFIRDANTDVPSKNLGSYTYIRKTTSPLDILRNINDSVKAKEQAARFAKQLNAGRGNLEDVTALSAATYFSAFRLTDALKGVGAGFGAKSTGSFADLTSNIFLKRILPVAGVVTGLSYLNYESKKITGTSVSGALATTASNIDLGLRGVADATGLTNVLKKQYDMNPISQYYSDDEFQSKEEREEWYKNGYASVRKGRYWGFGSSSEYRGGKIGYFEPNYVRRANSDWRDLGEYGDVDSKWKFSAIPTIRYPLSPVRRLLNPYWAEKQKYYSRPYPVTGGMFEEHSPWGTLLNPTVGRVLKPTLRMHSKDLNKYGVSNAAVLSEINKNIKDKANYIKVDKNSSITPVKYTNYNEYTNNGNSDNSSGYGDSNSSGFSPLSINDFSEGYKIDDNNGDVSLSTKVASTPVISDIIKSSGYNGFDDSYSSSSVLSTLRDINYSVYQRAADAEKTKPSDSQILNKPIFRSTSTPNEFLENRDFLSDLHNTVSTKENLDNLAYSIKELSGIYGFAMGAILPSGEQKNVLANAGRIDSFSRSFWDNSIGGFGGSLMEISRRFFPHEDRSVNRINNIKNTMPDWMPNKFRFGDPYTKVSKGEMRLPGLGYEDINDLHSDQFGRYGAIDRMKILGDVAPWSSEYKFWRETSKDLYNGTEYADEIEDVQERVVKTSQQKEFFPYKFKNGALNEESVYIKDITQNGFKTVGSDDEYTLAGIDNNTSDLTELLKPGKHYTMKTNKSKDGSKYTKAILYDENGESVSKSLVDEGLADKNEGTTAADLQSTYNEFDISRGALFETIAHAPIPFIHSKFMRIDSPLEAWKNEQVYGNSYSSWDHPIDSFIKPAFRKDMAASKTHMALGLASLGIADYIDKQAVGGVASGLSKVAMALTMPGAFTGGMIGFATKINADNVMKGSKIGAAVATTGFLWAQSDNPIFSTGVGAAAGFKIGMQLFENTKSGKTGALIGAGAGIALSALRNPGLNSDKESGEWIPDSKEEQWEIEEYFDRLKYIKYSGLYEKTAKLAEKEEGIELRKLVRKMNYNRENNEDKIENLQKRRDRLVEGGASDSSSEIKEVDSAIYSIQNEEFILQGGSRTATALAFKQAAESTVYGLTKNATWSQLLRAVPKNMRSYVLEFGKETDEKKQKEILKYINPYMRKPLQVLWKSDIDDVESNNSFFHDHYVPNSGWEGWNSDSSIDSIEAKTIDNEGMMLSDFGFYDSELNDKESGYIDNYDDSSPGIISKAKLVLALNGYGLSKADVDITPSYSTHGINIIADITNGVKFDIGRALDKTL